MSFACSPSISACDSLMIQYIENGYGSYCQLMECMEKTAKLLQA